MRIKFIYSRCVDARRINIDIGVRGGCVCVLISVNYIAAPVHPLRRNNSW